MAKILIPFAKRRYPLRGFWRSESPHAWERFPWAQCFDAPVVGKDGAERGNVPLHCSIAIRDPVYKYAEIVMDDSGIYIFVSANEIDRISDKGSAKYYFRGRKPNEKKGNLIDKINRRCVAPCATCQVFAPSLHVREDF